MSPEHASFWPMRDERTAGVQSSPSHVVKQPKVLTPTRDVTLWCECTAPTEGKGRGREGERERERKGKREEGIQTCSNFLAKHIIHIILPCIHTAMSRYISMPNVCVYMQTAITTPFSLRSSVCVE